MNKFLSVLAISALLFTSSAAFAHNEDGRVFPGLGMGLREDLKLRFEGMTHELHDLDEDVDEDDEDNEEFVVMGSVVSETEGSLNVDVLRGARVDAGSNVNVQASAELLEEVEAGNKVLIKGHFEGEVLVADHIRVMPAHKMANAAVGEITAVTDTSVTIKNNVTGEEKVVNTDDDTKVVINGEASATSDIQVGDKGIVKFKVIVDTFIAKFIRLFR